MTKFCIYTRVSTQKQGRSGLGLEAQLAMCQQYIQSQGGECSEHFKDVESGTHRDRPGLWQAIDYCKQTGATLVIAKLDRLARDVEFTFKVINSGIDIYFTDMPVVNTMILGVFASVAQYERELTSKRTKDALAACKARGTKLGNAKGVSMKAAQTASAKQRHESAKNNQENKVLWELMQTYHRDKLSYTEMAVRLNALHYTTPRKHEPYNDAAAKNAYWRLWRLYA